MEYFFDLINHYGLWLGFVFVAIENIGIPFPIEFVYLYGQELVNTGKSSFYLILLFFTAAHMTGAVIAYYIGLFGNSYVARRFEHHAGLIRARTRIEKWYSKYGSVTNLITRLVGYVRPWSSLIAGFGKESFYSFFAWTLLGTIIFNIIAILFSHSILFFWQTYPVAKYIIGAGFVFFFGGVWLLLPWLSKKFKL